MWEEWKQSSNTAIKAEKYKEKAFIDIYKVEKHYEIICSVSEVIIFHAIIVEKEKTEALKEYEKVKRDLKNIIDTYSNEDKLDDLCFEFVQKW